MTDAAAALVLDSVGGEKCRSILVANTDEHVEFL